MDPLHDRSGPGAFWTTVNAAEALPGVSTPLNWSWFGEAVERAFRWTFVDMGVLHPAAAMVPASVDDRLWGVFYGRAAANLDTFRRLADLTPGTSGDAFEQQIFGTVRPAAESHRSRRRYPVVAARLPRSAVALPRVLAEHRRSAEASWQASVLEAPADADAARARFADAHARFEAVMRPHTLAAMLAQGIWEQLSKLTAAAGRPGLETRLMTGFGGFEETRLMAELWAVSREQRTVSDFLSAHGYHGPTEGEISSRSWREDPAPVAQLIDTYRAMDEDAGPAAVEAARVIGEDLAGRGVVGDPDDVFHLTVPELGDPTLSDGIKKAVALRRERRDEYLRVRLPESWTGQPEAIPITAVEAAAAGSTLGGLAVSPGMAEGRARVVLDPLAGEPLQPGEILVCETTDPSWTSLFLVAAGLVIDIGGALSHGAIVARELGVPCVINTRLGTRVLRTGDRLRVDGDAGLVEVLESVA